MLSPFFLFLHRSFHDHVRVTGSAHPSPNAAVQDVALASTLRSFGSKRFPFWLSAKVGNIAQNGFNRGYSGRHGSKLGRGQLPVGHRHFHRSRTNSRKWTTGLRHRNHKVPLLLLAQHHRTGLFGRRADGARAHQRQHHRHRQEHRWQSSPQYSPREA